MKALIRLINNKNLKLNRFINDDHENMEESIEKFVNNSDEVLNIIDISNIRSNQNGSIEYSIIRENKTKTWFFVTKNIFILHLSISKYRDFYNLYKNSNEYRFIVYVRRREDIIVDSCNEIIIFCISHLLNNENYFDFMEINKKWSKRSAYILSKKLGFFIPLNKPYSDVINKDSSQLLGITILGNGVCHYIELKQTINFILKWINNDKNNLPYHNLILNH